MSTFGLVCDLSEIKFVVRHLAYETQQYSSAGASYCRLVRTLRCEEARGSDSGRLTFLKEIARSPEWLRVSTGKLYHSLSH